MALLPRSARLVFAFVVTTPLVSGACGRSEPGDYLLYDDGTSGGTDQSSTSGKPSTGTGASSGSGGATGTGASGGKSPGMGGMMTTGTAGMAAAGGVAIGGTGGGSGAAGKGGTGTAGTTATAGAAGMPNMTPISCGDQVCISETQSCCAGLAGLNCVPKGQGCEGAVLGCTLNADCPAAQVCCISLTGDTSAASACKPSCDFRGSARDRQLCQTDAECQMPFRYCTATVFGVNICTIRP